MVDFFSSLSVTSLVGAFAFLALIVPLVLHLLSRNPGRHVIVGSLSLIKHAQTQSVTEIRLTDLLLLILRLLVLALLALYLMGLVLEGTRPSLDGKAQAFVTPAWQQTMGAEAFSALAETFERTNITLLNTPESLQALVKAGEDAQANTAPHLYRTNLLADWRLLAGIPLGSVQVSEQKLSDTAAKALQQAAAHTLHLTLLPTGANATDTTDIMALIARMNAVRTSQMLHVTATPASPQGATGGVIENGPKNNTASDAINNTDSSTARNVPHSEAQLALWLSPAPPTQADLAALPPHVPVLEVLTEPTRTYAQETAIWPIYPYTHFTVFQLADMPPSDSTAPSTILWRSDLSDAPLLSVRSFAGRSLYRLHIALTPTASNLFDQPTALEALSALFSGVAVQTQDAAGLGATDLAGATLNSQWQERYLHAAAVVAPATLSAENQPSAPQATSPERSKNTHPLGPWLLVCAVILWGLERLVSEGGRQRA